MLRPEKQSLDLFAAGVDAIVEAQRRVALNYFEDGSVESACPPLKALLYIMAHGEYKGLGLEGPQLRELFERDIRLESSWYQERLGCKQTRDVPSWQRHLSALEQFQSSGITMVPSSVGFNLQDRVRHAQDQLVRVTSLTYLRELRGTIGADPFTGQITR